jgi:cysteine desulfurase
MMVNNETGALYDTATVKNLIRTNSPEALLHVDATQSYMKLRFTKRDIGADLITLSSHKIEGPKGVGALVIDSNLLKTGAIAPMILGGGQEGGFRSGTENVPGIAAFGEAARLASLRIDDCAKTTADLRKYLIERLGEEELSEIKPILPKSHAPHILNITLPGIKSETMLHYLSSLGIFVSSGSACSSNGGHFSSALTAFGRSESEADTSIRISFSHRNEKTDVDALVDGLKSGLEKLSRIR